MIKKLTAAEQLIWDRLVKGIPAPSECSSIEDEIARMLAEEIDREIIHRIITKSQNSK